MQVSIFNIVGKIIFRPRSLTYRSEHILLLAPMSYLITAEAKIALRTNYCMHVRKIWLGEETN